LRIGYLRLYEKYSARRIQAGQHQLPGVRVPEESVGAGARTRNVMRSFVPLQTGGESVGIHNQANETALVQRGNAT
jgi:hypothetical protein